MPIDIEEDLYNIIGVSCDMDLAPNVLLRFSEHIHRFARRVLRAQLDVPLARSVVFHWSFL